MLLICRSARLLALLFMVAILASCGPATLVIGIGPGRQDLTKTAFDTEPGSRGREIAVIDISGLIANQRRFELLREGENPVSMLHEQLVQARNDRDVQAVILRINSPGGTVTASDVMYREVLRFKEQSGKPVVALLMDVAASGGYYVACSADAIITYPTSVTGSVGVILQTISVKPALSRIGVQTDAIVSGPNKDAGSPLSTLEPEERAVLQAMVNDFYSRFVATVQQARPGIPEHTLSSVTDGRVMSGSKAVEVGLADQAGDLYTAFERAKQLAGVDHADLVIYHRPLRYVGSPYAAAPTQPSVGTQVNIATIDAGELLPGQDTPVGFYYLWSPGTH